MRQAHRRHSMVGAGHMVVGYHQNMAPADWVPVNCTRPEAVVHSFEGVVHKPEGVVHKPEGVVHKPEGAVHKPEAVMHTPAAFVLQWLRPS